jgi:signal transduction histidine kinase
MRALLAQLTDQPEAIPWPERRDIPRSLVGLLESRPSKPQADAAGELLELLATDPKWEVRKAVADALRYAPEDTFTKTLAHLGDDENTFVRRAAENALDRRRKAAAVSDQRRRGIPSIAERIAALERTHGPEAAKAAREVGEIYYDQLVGAVAHDVRGILTPLASRLKRLLEQMEQGSFQQGRMKRSLQQMQDRVGLLERLVDDMRSYSLPVPRRRRSQRLADILTEAERLAREDVEERGSSLDGVIVQQRVDDGLTVEVARDQFLMAFVNVIKNALESLTRDGSVAEPRIDIVACVTDGREIEVVVRDNGAGIEADDLKQLREFLPGSKTKKNEGTGFGLPIARRIIAAHGGTLTIESRPEEGTVVTIAMPLEHGGGEA